MKFTPKSSDSERSHQQRLSIKQRMQIRMRKSTQRRLKPRYFFLLLVILFIVTMIEGYATGRVQVPNSSDYPNENIQLSFVGDIMLGRYIESYSVKNGAELLYCGVSPVWENSDHVFANLECAILTDPEYEADRIDKNINLYANPDAVRAMMAAGIDTVSYANNHCFDYGEKAFQTSLDWFEAVGLEYAGATKPEVTTDGTIYHRTYTQLTAKSKSIGFLAFTDKYYREALHYGVLTSANAELYTWITESAQRNDLTIVYVHWGEEYTASVLPEQTKIAHALIDAGADLVIGSHPHVLQPIELYGNGIIFYSLGNFIMDQSNSFTRDSVIVQYNEQIDGSRYFELIPIRINDGCPQLASNDYHANRIVQTLTRALDETQYTVTQAHHILINF